MTKEQFKQIMDKLEEIRKEAAASRVPVYVPHYIPAPQPYYPQPFTPTWPHYTPWVGGSGWTYLSGGTQQ